MSSRPENSVSVLYIEENYGPEVWSFRPHSHGCYHMFYMDSGKGDFTVGGKEILLMSGQLLIVPPNTVHALLSKRTRFPNLREVLFEVNDVHLQESLTKLGICPSMDMVSLRLFDEICTLGNSRVESMKRYVEYFLCAFLAHLCMSIEDTDPLSLNQQLIDTTGYCTITKSIIMYIDRYYTKSISLDEMAAILGYSKSYLCIAFKKDCGVTINTYLNLVRINRMAQYLSYTDADIAFLSRQCGFCSISHFNRTFKQFLGISPGTYKRIRPVHFNEDIIAGPFAEPDNIERSKLQTIAERLGTILDKQKGNVVYNFEDSDEEKD